MKDKLPKGTRTEEIFDRKAHFKELHSHRKGTKIVNLYKEESVAKTKPTRNIKKQNKLNL